MVYIDYEKLLFLTVDPSRSHVLSDIDKLKNILHFSFDLKLLCNRKEKVCHNYRQKFRIFPIVLKKKRIQY